MDFFENEITDAADIEEIEAVESADEFENQEDIKAQVCIEVAEENNEPEAESDIPDDKIRILFYPNTLKSFIAWGKVYAVFMIISFSIGMCAIATIPAMIFGIIACLKLLNTCRDLKSRMITGAEAFSEVAGENFFESIKAMKKYYIWSVIAIVFSIILIIVLLIVFSPEISEFFANSFEEFYEETEDLPDNPFADEMFIRIKSFFKK